MSEEGLVGHAACFALKLHQRDREKLVRENFLAGSSKYFIIANKIVSVFFFYIWIISHVSAA